jgi:hypothetical protein
MKALLLLSLLSASEIEFVQPDPAKPRPDVRPVAVRAGEIWLLDMSHPGCGKYDPMDGCSAQIHADQDFNDIVNKEFSNKRWLFEVNVDTIVDIHGREVLFALVSGAKGNQLKSGAQ